MENVLTQQSKRYQFFAEKNEDLTKNYAELGKLMVELWSTEEQKTNDKHQENHIEMTKTMSEKSGSVADRRTASHTSSQKRDSLAFTSPRTFDLETGAERNQEDISSINHTVRNENK